MRVVWSAAAEDDLDAIVMYIADESVGNALALDQRVRDRVRMLVDFPDAGKWGRYPNTHELVIPHDRCVVIYRVDDDFVYVLRVIHGGQRWPVEL